MHAATKYRCATQRIGTGLLRYCFDTADSIDAAQALPWRVNLQCLLRLQQLSRLPATPCSECVNFSQASALGYQCDGTLRVVARYRRIVALSWRTKSLSRMQGIFPAYAASRHLKLVYLCLFIKQLALAFATLCKSTHPMGSLPGTAVIFAAASRCSRASPRMGCC